MAVNQKSPTKANPSSATPRTAPISVPDARAPQSDGSKQRKKKKKGKGKAGSYDEDDEEEIVSTDWRPQGPRRHNTATGLSPDLDAAHLSATAALEEPPRASREDLQATANELYSRVFDTPPPSGGGLGSGFEETDEYWKSLPPNTRNFVRNVYAQASLTTAGSGSPGEKSKAQTMWAVAQKMMQGPRPGGTKAGPPGAYPDAGIPFDSAIFTDPALRLSLEAAFHTVASSGRSPPAGLADDQGFDGEYYSEEEVDEGVDEVDVEVDVVDGHHHTSQPQQQSMNGRSRQTPVVPVDGSVNSDPGRNKKNKKKKKKGGAISPPRTLPPPPQQPQPQQQQPPPTAAPRPMPPNTTRPPAPAPQQSSRAAGKQPMSYSPMNATAQNPPMRTTSARAASKAPLTNYAHNHHHHPSPPASNASAPGPGKPRPPAGTAAGAAGPAGGSKPSKIWSTNSNEERERIKEFWLGLGEQERRDLVKLEKEAVLRKMKEQQKHSCSCAVCGRKRTAIEEELEVLYEAYYDELEDYAAKQQRHASAGGPPPPGPGPFPGSVALDKDGAVIGAGTEHASNTKHPPPSRKSAPLTNGARKVNKTPAPAQVDDEYDEPDEEEYEDDEEEYEEDDEGEEEDDGEGDEDDVDEDEDDGEERDRDPGVDKAARRRGAAPGTQPQGKAVPPAKAATNGQDGPFSFGSNFTAAGPGSILTVADDLLKNDGQKFLEMMEQLAERRMLREEEATASIEEDSDEEDDDEDDEDDDEDDEDEDDEEEETVMTEEQKMQEGKRMFSIFAARMFEQRVLQAYRERVAAERQLQLLRELADEERVKHEKESKKQNANQKKKDKKKQQKAVKDEERLKKEAEKAAEEAALKAKQEAAEELQRKKKEEEKARKEAERFRQAEEKIRQAEEKRKRVAEEQRKAAEKAALEQKKAAEKAALEQKRLAEKAAERAAKEKERKEREDKERKAKEDAEREQKEKMAREEEARKEREKEEKEKKAAAEQLILQQRQAAAKAALAAKPPPVSPRNGTFPSGSSQRASGSGMTPKKILTKPQVPAQRSIPPSTPSMSQPVPRQPVSRPTVVTNTQHALPSHQPPSNSSASASHLAIPHPPSTPILPMGNYMPPSPHQPIGHPGYGSPPGPYMQQHPSFSSQSPQLAHHGLASSSLPRGYGGPMMDYPFDNGLGFQKAGNGLPNPIGPPKGLPSPGPSQMASGSMGNPGFPGRPGDGIPMTNGSPGHVRRGSAHEPIGRNGSLTPGFGVVHRPMAPIGRPIGSVSSTVNGDDDKNSSGSPSRRSPSPTGVMGSAALINDDDEPILPASGRRVGLGAMPLAQSWGSMGEPLKPLEPLGSRQFGSGSWGFQPPGPSNVASSNVWGGPFGGVTHPHVPPFSSSPFHTSSPPQGN